MTELLLRPAPGDVLGIEGQIDAADERALSIARGMTDAQGGWRVAAAQPSVAECLACHLRWLERAVPVLDTAVGGVRSGWRARLGEVRSGWWWQLLPRVAEFAPSLPVGAGEVRETCQRKPVREIMARILALHAQVRSLVRLAEVRDLRSARVRLPYCGPLEAPLDVALAMVPAMARRQLRRAERVRLHMNFPRR